MLTLLHALSNVSGHETDISQLNNTPLIFTGQTAAILSNHS